MSWLKRIRHKKMFFRLTFPLERGILFKVFYWQLSDDSSVLTAIKPPAGNLPDCLYIFANDDTLGSVD